MPDDRLPAPNLCGCGCETPTARRYRPGHDARHKADLKDQTRSTQWWVRERAVQTMVAMGWGRHVDSTILATTPVRSRHRGRFCETRHVESLHGVVLDDQGTGHSVWFCPAASSRGRWVRGLAGWLCEACIHVKDWSEIVHDPAYGTTSNSADLPVYVPARRQPKKPPRSRPRPVATLAADIAQLVLWTDAEPDPVWPPLAA